MVTGYASCYPDENFEVVEVEKSFIGEIRNPDTGRPSQTFVMAGKVDAIVKRPDGMYLLEHKTASTIDASYLDKLWTDTQIALYSHYLRELGYPIVGVIYNVLLKSRLQQKAGESEAEYAARRMELAGSDVRVICVEPGLVMTDLHRHLDVHPRVTMGIDKPLQPADVARCVRFVLEQPAHVNIPRLMVLPTDQEI